MKVKLPIRWLSVKDDKESKEKRKLDRLIGKEMDEEEELQDIIKYDYRSFVCDTVDIKTFAEYDKEHTTLGLHMGDFYVIKVPFAIFEVFYNHVTGQDIKDIESYKFAKN